MKDCLNAELALGLFLALESTETEISFARSLVRDAGCADAEGKLAEELLARAQARIEKMRRALGWIDERD